MFVAQVIGRARTAGLATARSPRPCAQQIASAFITTKTDDLTIVVTEERDISLEIMADGLNGLADCYGDDGDGEDSQEEELHEDGPCEATQGEFRRMMQSMVKAQREAAMLKRELEGTQEDLDRYVAAEAAASAQFAEATRLNHQLTQQRDLIGARLSQVELTLRQEREEHAPVKDELYRKSEAANMKIKEYSQQVSELHQQLNNQVTPPAASPETEALPFKDYGAHEPDVTGCVACAIAINKKYHQFSVGS